MEKTKRTPKKPLATAKKRLYTLEIAEGAQRAGRPKVTGKVGESPPQYADPDEGV